MKPTKRLALLIQAEEQDRFMLISDCASWSTTRTAQRRILDQGSLKDTCWPNAQPPFPVVSKGLMCQVMCRCILQGAFFRAEVLSHNRQVLVSSSVDICLLAPWGVLISGVAKKVSFLSYQFLRRLFYWVQSQSARSENLAHAR